MAPLIDGWQEMDLPSIVNDLTRLYDGYGARLNADDLQTVAQEVDKDVVRIDFMFGNHVPLVTFALKPADGEMLVAFPYHYELVSQTVRTCRRNGATLVQCSDIGSRFVAAFERLVLPSEPHAAETLKR